MLEDCTIAVKNMPHQSVQTFLDINEFFCIMQKTRPASRLQMAASAGLAT
jgi:hypothetical protein